MCNTCKNYITIYQQVSEEMNFPYEMVSGTLTLILHVAQQLNFDRLLAKMWEEMGLVRVYTKPQGQQPDFGDPVVLSAVSCKSFFFSVTSL